MESYRLALYRQGGDPALTAALRALGCQVSAWSTLSALETHLRREAPDAILLRGQTPALAERLTLWRASGYTAPALFLRDGDEDQTRIAGGWVLPPEPERILAWLDEHMAASPDETIVRLADGSVDLLRREVLRGEACRLTTTEAKLLAALAARPGEVRQRGWLLARVWGYRRATQTRALDNAILRLRSKIEVDPARPRHIVTVRGAGFRFVPPPSQPALAAPPTLLDRLFGRDAQIARCVERLRETPVLALVGPGGVGKTRLAREVAARWPGEVAWCDLTGASSRGAMERAAGAAIGGQRGPVGPQLRARGGLLLVLDDLDRLVEEAGALSSWAEEAPGTRLLVTSRERPRAPGVRCEPVAPLSEDEASALYLDRARAGRPDFAPDPGQVRALVRRLDGLPLAIEFAAARAAVLPPAALLAQSERALELLYDSGPASGLRHRSLQEAIGWSWGIMSPSERDAWVRCAVFEGAFGLMAAAAVLELGEVAALERLERLVSGSVLTSVADPPRYRMLQTVREYALGRSDCAAERVAAQRAHGAFHLELARGLLLPFAWTDAAASAARGGWLQAELRALRERGAREAALALAIWEDSAGASGAALGPGPLCGLGGASHAERVASAYLRLRRLEGAGDDPAQRVEVERTLREIDESATALERAHGALLQAIARRLAGDHAGALEALDEALRIAPDAPDSCSRALQFRAYSLRALGRRAEAEAAQRASLQAARRSGRVELVGRALLDLGRRLVSEGDREGVEASLPEAMRIFRGVGDRQREAEALAAQAGFAALDGRLAEAEAIAWVAIELLGGAGRWDKVIQLHLTLGGLMSVAERAEDGRRYLERAGALLREHPARWARENLRVRRLYADVDRPGAVRAGGLDLPRRLGAWRGDLLGLAAMFEGRFEDAAARFAEGVQEMEAQRFTRPAALLRLMRATALNRSARSDDALREARTADEVLARRGFRPGQIHAALQRGLLEPEPELRRALFERAEALSAGVDSPTLRALAARLARGSDAAIPEPGNVRLRWLFEDARGA